MEAGPSVPSPTRTPRSSSAAQRRHAGAELPVGARAVGHRHVVCGEQVEVGVVEPDRVRGQHPAVEHTRLGQQRRRAHAVAFAHELALGHRLGEVDLHQRVAPLRLGGDGPQPLRRHGVGRVRPEAEVQAALPARPWRRRAGTPASSKSSQRSSSPGPRDVEDGRGVHRRGCPSPASASTTGPGWRYCSQVVVDAVAEQLAPRRAPCPSRRPRRVSRASRGQTDSLSQRSSGSPSPALRTSVIGRVAVAVDQPGHEQAAELAHLGPAAGRHLPGVADPGDQAVLDLHRARRATRCRRRRR